MYDSIVSQKAVVAFTVLAMLKPVRVVFRTTEHLLHTEVPFYLTLLTNLYFARLLYYFLL